MTMEARYRYIVYVGESLTLTEPYLAFPNGKVAYDIATRLFEEEAYKTVSVYDTETNAYLMKASRQ